MYNKHVTKPYMPKNLMPLWHGPPIYYWVSILKVFLLSPSGPAFFKKSSKNGPTAKSLCFEGFLLKLSGISFCNNDSTHSATGDLVK
jgi:hypothetical protein